MEEGMKKNEIERVVNYLKKFSSLENKNHNCHIIKVLESLIKISETEDVSKFISEKVFLGLLTSNNERIVTEAAKTIAEISKTVAGREKFTNREIVSALIKHMEVENFDILSQTCRALGNICYENVSARNLVEDRAGLEGILNVINKGVNSKGKKGADYLKDVSSGLLYNFLLMQTKLNEEEMKQKVIPTICNLLESGDVKDQKNIFPILTLLTEENILFLNEKLVYLFSDIIVSDITSENSEMCLEYFNDQVANDDDKKVLLAKSGICEKIVQLMDKYVSQCTNDCKKFILRKACNLIVLILNGDESMNYLYGKGEGIVYKKLKEWLENKDEDLIETAVLAMGNFARSDINSELMVVQGVHAELLKLLSRNNTRSGDCILQFHLLSSLRNLVILSKNKPIILANDLIDILRPMIEFMAPPSLFKLLALLRIVIDGQEEAAILLSKNEEFVKKLVDWSESADHPGVQGEANRLLASLIINSRDKQVVECLIKNDGMKHLVKMLNSKHPIMQNEALLSLNIISAICLSQSEKAFLDSDIGSTLKMFLEKSAPTIKPPIVCNALSLTHNLIKSDIIKKHLEQPSDLLSLWRKLLNLRKAELKVPGERLINEGTTT